MQAIGQHAQIVGQDDGSPIEFAGRGRAEGMSGPERIEGWVAGINSAVSGHHPGIIHQQRDGRAVAPTQRPQPAPVVDVVELRRRGQQRIVSQLCYRVDSRTGIQSAFGRLEPVHRSIRAEQYLLPTEWLLHGNRSYCLGAGIQIPNILQCRVGGDVGEKYRLSEWGIEQ